MVGDRLREPDRVAGDRILRVAQVQAGGQGGGHLVAERQHQQRETRPAARLRRPADQPAVVVALAPLVAAERGAVDADRVQVRLVRVDRRAARGAEIVGDVQPAANPRIERADRVDVVAAGSADRLADRRLVRFLDRLRDGLVGVEVDEQQLVVAVADTREHHRVGGRVVGQRVDVVGLQEADLGERAPDARRRPRAGRRAHRREQHRGTARWRRHAVLLPPQGRHQGERAVGDREVDRRRARQQGCEAGFDRAEVRLVEAEDGRHVERVDVAVRREAEFAAAM